MYKNGNAVKVTPNKEDVCFLFVSRKPLKEPVAWRGLIVMNTDEELQITFEEFRKGTFIKH